MASPVTSGDVARDHAQAARLQAGRASELEPPRARALALDELGLHAVLAPPARAMAPWSGRGRAKAALEPFTTIWPVPPLHVELALQGDEPGATTVPAGSRGRAATTRALVERRRGRGSR